MTLSGVDVSASQTIPAASIGNLVYTPAPDAIGPNRSSFDFTVNDSSSGTVAATMTLDVGAVNDLPVLDTSFTPLLPNLPAIRPKNFVIAGTPIGALVAHASDVDGDPNGIAVTGYDGSRGQWQYSVNSGAIWTAFPEVADDSALLLANDGSTQIRFVPNKASKGVKPFTRGFADLTFRAWDQSDGAIPVTPLVDAGSPASTAYSSRTEHVWVAVGKTTPVVDVNGHPVLRPIPIPKVVPLKPVASAAYPVKSFLGLLARETDPTRLFGIAVSAASGTGAAGSGEWQFNTGKGGWQPLGAVSDVEALLLRPTDRVRFVKGATFDGHADLTYHTWDMVAETFGTKVDATVAGFSLATETAIANAAPVLTPANPTLSPVQPGTTSQPMLVSALLGTAATDVEQTTLGMYVFGPRGGTWEYSLNGTDWIKVTRPVYLAPTAQIRFTAAIKARVGMVAGLSFKAWDQTLQSLKTVSKATDRIEVEIVA